MKDTSTTQNLSVGNESSVKDYFTIMKPSVMVLVVFTSIIGIIKSEVEFKSLVAIISVLSISIGTAAAAAFNMWYDRDIDAIMSRTKNRPIVLGKIPPENALLLSLILTILSVLILLLVANFKASMLLLFSIFFYAIVYTVFLKRHTVQNIVIGGLAGALPPLIGYTAITNNIVSVFPILLVCIIFFWTPAHFWSLSIYRAGDYKACNVPMLPNIKGITYTKHNILIYSVVTVLFAFSIYVLGYVGVVYVIPATYLNIKFIYHSFSLYFDKSDHHSYAKKAFFFSIFYLFGIFFLILLDYYSSKFLL